MTTNEYHRERQQGQLVAEFITGEAEIEIDATAAKLTMLRAAMERGGGEARMAVVDIEGIVRLGMVFYVTPAGSFHIAYDNGDMWAFISPAEIGQRVFIAGPWPADRLHAGAFQAGECPVCGEHMEFFPVAGVVACPDDCGFGHEIEAFPAQVMKAAVNA